MSIIIKNDKIISVNSLEITKHTQSFFRKCNAVNSDGIFQKDDTFSLIIGLDLAEEVTQVCYRDLKTNTIQNFAIKTNEIQDFFEKFQTNVRIVMESCSNTHLIYDKATKAFFNSTNDCDICAVSHSFLNKFTRRYKSDKKDAQFLYEAGKMGTILKVNMRSPSDFIYKDIFYNYERAKDELRSKIQVFNADLKQYELPVLDHRNMYHFFDILLVHFNKAFSVSLTKADISQRNLKKSKKYKSKIKHQKMSEEARIRVTQIEILLKNFFFIHQEILNLNKRVKMLERDMERLTQMNEDISIIASIPGVSPTLAVGLKGVIGDINKFDNASKLTSFLGLSPNSTGSGGETTLYGQIDSGDSYIKRALYRSIFASFISIRNHINPLDFSDFLNNLKGKTPKQATFKIMYKVVKILFRLLKNKEFYCNEIAPLGYKKCTYKYSVAKRESLLNDIYEESRCCLEGNFLTDETEETFVNRLLKEKSIFSCSDIQKQELKIRYFYRQLQDKNTFLSLF